jgi:GNAT superfamily N-acetyltransferase
LLGRPRPIPSSTYLGDISAISLKTHLVQPPIESFAMAIAYRVETIDEVLDDMRPLWDLHWDEIALDKEKVPLNPDVATFRTLEEAGLLLIITARDDGRLVGYHVSIVRPHLHYKHSLTAYADMYFLHPDYRGGMAGVKLFKYLEQELRELGVDRIYQGTKMHKDVGRLFERLGYKETERLFVKWIGD